jgi:predicted transcriptional regulator
MRQAILISIQPKWCEKIASGKKTVEIRKTKPKLNTLFKCYIYCTNQKTNGDFILCKSKENTELFGYNKAIGINKGFKRDGDVSLKGKVIGEFICDEIFPIRVFENGSIQDYMCHRMERSCVPYDEIAEYIGFDKTGYGWHISNLVIYDTPKELREFHRECDYEKDCGNCPHLFVENTPSCYETWCEVDEHIPIKRPPQSWGYVDEIGGIDK